MTTMMKDEFMQQIATEQAWKELSQSFAWTESLLEKYSEKVDWKAISDNGCIVWTIPMLQKFAKKLNWDELSDHARDDWFTEAHLEAFKEKWDWSKVVEAKFITEAIIDKYIDYWDWETFINPPYYSSFMDSDHFEPIRFYEKYKQHIPMSKLQESDLWKKIVEQMTHQLKTEVLS